jgi:hypothetical protein
MLTTAISPKNFYPYLRPDFKVDVAKMEIIFDFRS